MQNENRPRDPAFANDFNPMRFVEAAARTICAEPGTVPYDFNVVIREKNVELIKQ